MAKFKLVVESGKERGREYPVGDAPLTIGRSSQNDITLSDELLSRHHCSVGMRGSELWITDLASVNGTQVNGRGIDDSRLSDGDKIMVGDVCISVADTEKNPSSSESGHEGLAPESSAAAAPEAKDAQPASTQMPAAANGGIDLGFGNQDGNSDRHASHKSLVKTAVTAAAAAIVIIAVLLFLQSSEHDAPSAAQTPAPPPEPENLQIHYSKTEGSGNNVFRYEMHLGEDRVLHVKIDDLSQNRHMIRKSDGPVDQKIVEELKNKIKDSGFDGLDTEYIGINPRNHWFESSAVIIVGKDAKTVKIRNKTEPPQYASMRRQVESFVNTELGLWAIEYSKEKLTDLAIKNLETGQKLYSEREIRPDNLFNAIVNFKSCLTYLETLEPKPDFFNEALNAMETAEKELDGLYTEANWQADHAISIRDWNRAAEILRNLIEMIPDRTDQRNKDTERRLLEVEARLRALEK